MNFVLPSFGIFFKKIEVPIVEGKDIKNIVEYQIEGMFGKSKNNFVIDYSFVEKKETVVISFVCVYKKIFDLYYAIAKRAGFKVGKILMEQKCYCDYIKDTDYLVVDIGGEVTSFSVFCNNELTVVDNLYKGGEVLTSLYSSGNNISFDEAEKDKREKGLLIDDEKYYFYPQLNNILEKINLFLKEYSFKKVYFIGGGSNIKGGLDFFNKNLNIPVSFFDFSEIKNTNLNDDLLNRLGNSLLINLK